MAYAARLLHSRDAAQDVVQETFLRAWRNIEVLTLGYWPVRRWLLVVARNIVIDRARAREIRPREVSDTGIPVAVAGGVAEPDHADRVATAVTVTEAVAGLSAEHRHVLEQLYFRDRSLADTAAGIGVSVGTVKSRAHYAICALRKTLGRREAAR
jgi:RNA polymerase sigma-70 factor (ECF subfamily)